MLAYRTHPAISRAAFIAQIEAHEAADQIVQGTYWSNGRGCAVGCSIHSATAITGKLGISFDDHALYEALIGVPQTLARIEDRIFEGLPIERAKRWPAQFARAIPDGADLSLVWPRFALWMLAEITLPSVDPQFGDVRAAIEQTMEVFENWTKTGKANESAAAESAAESAWAAAWAAAAWAYTKIADKLLVLLAEAPTP